MLNFHTAEIEIDGMFVCSCGTILLKGKAVFANNPDAVLQITQTTDPFMCNTIGKSVGINKAKWHKGQLSR